MTRKYVIVGAEGLGREIATNLELVIAKEGGTLLGFVDDRPDALGPLADRYPPILGKLLEFNYTPDLTVLLGIGEPAVKMRLAPQLEARGAVFGNFIHPTAIVLRTAKLGRGCVLMRDSTVSADSTLGDFVLLNGFAGVGHDVTVGDGTTVSSYVDVCGRVKLGKNVFIGSHASILPDVKVGHDARIGAGSIVARDVKPGSTVYQPIARVLRDAE
jgi:sugar O-acyltransferase (sialic acid O-acetyltransferase NeuD family)